MAAVAPPPNVPPKAAVVPPWHIAVTAPPTLTVGLGLTMIDMPLLVAGKPVAQKVEAEFITTVITLPFMGVAGEYVEFVALPTFIPFTCH
jgi:hypothetical protein